MLNIKLITINLIFICLCIIKPIKAEEQIPLLGGIGTSFHQGYLWPHRASLRHLDGYYPSIFQLEIYRNTSGHKSWHHQYNFPKTGFHLSYANIKAPAIGYSLAAGFFMEPYLFYTRLHSLSFRAGTGIAYVSNPYDEVNNPDNQMHGSHFNALMHGILKYNFHLNNRWDLIVGVSMTHYSNGVFKLPNAGSNIPAFTLGADYRFTDRQNTRTPLDSLIFSKKGIKINVFFGGGIKLLDMPVNQHYPVGSVNFYLSKRISYKNSLQFGANYLHDKISNVNVPQGQEPFIDYQRASVLAGHELHISKFSLLTQFGFYFYHDHPFENFWFQRYGLKYYISPNVFCTYGLLTHYGKADFLELSLGFSF